MSPHYGVPEVIRTPDLPLRRRSLYPAELRKHITIVIISQFCNFVKCLFDKKLTRHSNKFGSRYKSKAEIAGGIILVLIGLKIFLEGVGILK